MFRSNFPSFARAVALSALSALSAIVAWSATSGRLSAQVRYVAFGDSITQGVGDDSTAFGGEGYPARLQTLLRARGVNAFVDNFGKGGEDTVEGLGRIDSALGGGGDVLLLMEGTNDVTTNIGLETTLQNLIAMARKAEKARLRVVHATNIPRLPNVTVDYRSVLTQRLAENLRDEAGTNGRRLADPFEVFSAQGSLFTRYYARLDADPVGHPNGAGYDLLAGIFADLETARDTAPPVPGVTTPATGSRDVSPTAAIVMDVWDFGTEPDPSSLLLNVNGTDVTPTRTGEGELIQLRYQPPTPWTGVVRVALKGRDRATPPNEAGRESLRFVIQGTQLLAGDLDQDGRVDGEDLVTFALHFGARRTQPGRYLAAADFDNDGEINGVDLAALAANFGRSAG